MEKKIKVLEVLHGLAYGGIESFVMSVAENIDSSKYQIDYALATDYEQFHEECVLKNGNRIFKTKNLGNLKDNWLHFLRLIRLMRKEKYDVVHTHIDYFNGVNLLAAWIAGVPIRISHSHNTRSANAKTDQENFKIKVYHILMGALIKMFSTKRLGCSDMANEWMYGNKWTKDKNCHVVVNAIDTERFDYTKYDKKKFQKIFSLNPEKINFCTIGRMCEQKNSLFLLEVVHQLFLKMPKIHFSWISNGRLEDEIQRKIQAYGMQDIFTFLGTRRDIPEFLAAHDCFLFPSKWEGLGIVLVEAQFMNIPCFISDTIPQLADIGGVNVISLQKSSSAWADEILNALKQKNYRCGTDGVRSKAFEAKEMVHQMEQYYAGM